MYINLYFTEDIMHLYVYIFQKYRKPIDYVLLDLVYCLVLSYKFSNINAALIASYIF